MKVSFQYKLIIFAFGILVAVQVLSAIAVYFSTRSSAIENLRVELAATEQVFLTHLENTTRAMAETTTAVTLDFAFRNAIAQGDKPTRRSVLENFRDRVAADRVLLVSLEGEIDIDTAREGAAGRPFPFVDLVERADLDGVASDIVSMDGRLYDLVLLPVLAPDAVAWIAFAMEIDDAFAVEIRNLAPFPTWVSFIMKQDGVWRLGASTATGAERKSLESYIAANQALPVGPSLVDVEGRTFVTTATEIHGEGRKISVALLFHSTIDPALARTRELLLQLAALLVAALVITLIGAVFLARGITRPVRDLTTAAGRVREGDYSAEVPYHRQDEFGALSEAFNKMMTDIQRREETISHQARNDALTGLPNRREFLRQVNERAATSPDKPFAAVIVGLERVQEMNSSLGFEVGDRIIKGVAERLRGHVADDDMVARIGGDEFGLVLNGEQWAQGGHALLTSLIRAMEHPITAREGNVDISLRFGLALYPEHGENGANLVMSAELAMYKARLAGKPTHIFDPVEDRPRPEALMLMGEMRKGLETGQFQLVYQPKVDIATGRVVAAEALSRWQHPHMKNLSPDTFVPLAEQTGNIRHLTRWMLEQATTDCAAWRAEGLELKLSVNLSAKDIATNEIVMILSRLLVDKGLPAEVLTLEITESALMDEPEEALATLDSLSDMGMSVSVDDFGTGYSSMSYLKRLPADELKIDKSFVLNLANSREDDVIVRSTVDLGRNLGLSVTAEGVEDLDSFLRLREIGCTIAQGYYIARPMPLDKFLEFCKSSPWANGTAVPVQHGAVAGGQETDV